MEEGREGGVERARGVGKEKGKEGKRCTWGTMEEHQVRRHSPWLGLLSLPYTNPRLLSTGIPSSFFQATATYTNPMPHASAPPPSSGSSFNPPAYSGFPSGR